MVVVKKSNTDVVCIPYSHSNFERKTIVTTLKSRVPTSRSQSYTLHRQELRVLQTKEHFDGSFEATSTSTFEAKKNLIITETFEHPILFSTLKWEKKK